MRSAGAAAKRCRNASSLPGLSAFGVRCGHHLRIRAAAEIRLPFDDNNRVAALRGDAKEFVFRVNAFATRRPVTVPTHLTGRAMSRASSWP